MCPSLFCSMQVYCKAMEGTNQNLAQQASLLYINIFTHKVFSHPIGQAMAALIPNKWSMICWQYVRVFRKLPFQSTLVYYQLRGSISHNWRSQMGTRSPSGMANW